MRKVHGDFPLAVAEGLLADRPEWGWKCHVCGQGQTNQEATCCTNDWSKVTCGRCKIILRRCLARKKGK
jgi:hypothetical protein